jgi:hypothetical protein
MEKSKMEKKLIRVTYKQQTIYSIGTYGRGQVLINKTLTQSEIDGIRRQVKAVIATIGNLRWNEKHDLNKRNVKLLDIAKKTIEEMTSSGHLLVHLEVNIADCENKDYHELLPIT